jgi:protein MpaA
VGCIHGDEAAGEAITRRLRTLEPPAGTAWWLVDQFNPDGCLAGTRQNANKVDLNRNSPWNWKPLTGYEYSGTGALSEPESRAINRLISRVRPTVSIWYHQHASLVDSSSGGDIEQQRRYAQRVRLPLKPYGVMPGSIVTWQNRVFDPGASAFVVELPAGALSRSSVARHVAAIRAL